MGVMGAIDSETRQDRLAEGIQARGRTARADDGHGWRPGIPYHARRQLQRVRRQDRQRLWQFQTGSTAGGPAASVRDRRRAVHRWITSANVWAFKLGGTLQPRPAPPSPRAAELFVGQITDTRQIETASLIRDNAFTGARYMTDEFAFNPVPREGDGGDAGHMAQQRQDGPHGRRAGRLVDHRAHRSGGSGRGDTSINRVPMSTSARSIPGRTRQIIVE